MKQCSRRRAHPSPYWLSAATIRKSVRCEILIFWILRNVENYCFLNVINFQIISEKICLILWAVMVHIRHSQVVGIDRDPGYTCNFRSGHLPLRARGNIKVHRKEHIKLGWLRRMVERWEVMDVCQGKRMSTEIVQKKRKTGNKQNWCFSANCCWQTKLCSSVGCLCFVKPHCPDRNSRGVPYCCGTMSKQYIQLDFPPESHSYAYRMCCWSPWAGPLCPYSYTGED